MSTSAAPAFVCPACRGVLTHADVGGEGEGEAYLCTPCARRYPVVLGIADFRLRPDPWIGFEDDRDKGRRLAERARALDLAGTVRAYWEMTPNTPRERAESFTAFVLDGERRSAEWLDAVDRGEAAPDGPWLDVGCGTGDLVAVVARRGHTVVGVDIAFRWLVVARKRLEEAGLSATLVCCDGEHLPFPDDAFARVVSLGTIEHCLDASALVSEGRRVLRAGGSMRARTVNRYTLREPHVGVWGVGFVPRRWADAYVRWRSGQRYLHHRPLSRRELRRGFRSAGFARVDVRPAGLLPADRARLGRLAWAGGLYEAARELPVVGAGLCWIAPILDVRGQVA